MKIDPIALCLVRELTETDESLKAVNAMIKQSPKKINWREAYEDYWQRVNTRDTAAEALLSHLLIMPCPQIDTGEYEAMWKESLMLTEDERENGKLWDAVEDIAQRAIALYGLEVQS